ncbi:MAG: MBL fold metallo-hydrolase [Bacteroidetes bacterium]|nr:MBL fold metallo-hydrolase [Bacteroidota bacterium]
MKLHIINAENFKLDGGACFGVVPKSIWSKTVSFDENNMVNVCNRLLLIETGNHKILIDSGIGNKQDEKYLSHFYISGNTLEENLIQKGFTPADITDVILTHLHYDHVGGCVKYNNERTKLLPVFPNAIIYCSKAQWDWATNPNFREKASYLPENYMSLFENGQLEFIHEEQELFEGILLKIYNGHTTGQLIPEINYKGRKIVYTADFIASTAHVPVPYIPAYDVQPLLSVKEKAVFYEKAVPENYVLFFEHDYLNECCTVQNTEKGFRVNEIFKLEEL